MSGAKKWAPVLSLNSLPERGEPGFTLLELLVAMSLFAVLSMMTFSVLRALIDTRRQTGRESERLAAVQMTVSRLALDIQQARDRGIRDEYGIPQPAMLCGLTADTALEFTRGGRRNTTPGKKGSGMQRLRYLLVGRKLIRESWPVLDRGPGLTTFRQQMLDEVDGFEIRLLDDKGEWHASWPPPSPPSAPSAAGGEALIDDRLPVAVDILLDLPDWGRIRRRLPVTAVVGS